VGFIVINDYFPRDAFAQRMHAACTITAMIYTLRCAVVFESKELITSVEDGGFITASVCLSICLFSCMSVHEQDYEKYFQSTFMKLCRIKRLLLEELIKLWD